MNNVQNENDSQIKDSIKEVKPFTMRKWFIYMMIPTLVMLVLTLFVLKGSMYSDKESVVNYNETGDIDYKVYLKDNSFYSDKYLGKDMQYVASLIDRININYKFDMKTDNNLNFNYKYNIKADLLIIGGTSLTVYPAAGLIRYFRGNSIVLNNKDATQSDSIADLVIHDSIGKVLGEIKV